MKYVINYLVSINVQLFFEYFNIEGLDKYMSFNMKLKLVLQHVAMPGPTSPMVGNTIHNIIGICWRNCWRMVKWMTRSGSKIITTTRRRRNEIRGSTTSRRRTWRIKYAGGFRPNTESFQFNSYRPGDRKEKKRLWDGTGRVQEEEEEKIW